jgi:hypothetical protein
MDVQYNMARPTALAVRERSRRMTGAAAVEDCDWECVARRTAPSPADASCATDAASLDDVAKRRVVSAGVVAAEAGLAEKNGDDAGRSKG